MVYGPETLIIRCLNNVMRNNIVKPIKPNTIEPMKIITFHVLWHFTHVPFPLPRANYGLLHLAHNRLP